jgi:hypothetical protein
MLDTCGIRVQFPAWEVISFFSKASRKTLGTFLQSARRNNIKNIKIGSCNEKSTLARFRR